MISQDTVVLKKNSICEQDTRKRISNLENNFDKIIKSFDDFKEIVTNYMRQSVMSDVNTAIPDMKNQSKKEKIIEEDIEDFETNVLEVQKFSAPGKDGSKPLVTIKSSSGFYINSKSKLVGPVIPKVSNFLFVLLI